MKVQGVGSAAYYCKDPDPVGHGLGLQLSTSLTPGPATGQVQEGPHTQGPGIVAGG